VAIRIDPRTAQVSARTDPLPQILHGIPLDLRTLSIRLRKPGFTVNPTSCDPSVVSGTLRTEPQEAVSLRSRFQLGECGRLGFKPKLALRLSGPTHRSAHPSLQLAVRPRAGDANIRRATVLLPATELFETKHIRAVCSRDRYAENSCPARSVYGYAKAWSPLLDEPLAGPVYLRSSKGDLPDLVASLDGQVHVDLVARVDSLDSRIRTTLRGVPDVPLDKAVLTLRGGRDGLFVNNADLCRSRPRAAGLLVAHNNKTRRLRPAIRLECR
jgi:hypothetical protein